MAKKEEIGFVEMMKKFSRAGMPNPHSPNRNVGNLDELPTLEERIERIFKIIKQDNRPADHMIFFVMYDIESTKVRNQIVKYLQREGCTGYKSPSFWQICLLLLTTVCEANWLRCRSVTKIKIAYL